jgi:hypothetical protein
VVVLDLVAPEVVGFHRPDALADGVTGVAVRPPGAVLGDQAVLQDGGVRHRQRVDAVERHGDRLALDRFEGLRLGLHEAEVEC